MAIDLTGIHNENEFYTSHYLHEILEKDLKDVLREWRTKKEEEGTTPPHQKLAGLKRRYFELRSDLQKEKDEGERMRRQRPFLKKLLEVLGYEPHLDLRPLDDGGVLPVLTEIEKPGGAPVLWALEVIDVAGEDTDPLELSLLECQFPEGHELDQGLLERSLTEVITRHVFGRKEPPRWVLLINDAQLVLLDRTKWNEKRLLRFDLPEILGRREKSTLKAMAALVHRESISPEEGLALLDTLDENSHKHAFAVSEDLKYALRESIELLGNEAVWYLRERRRKGVFSGEEKLDAEQLTLECLRYMYRLLFLFYIEARPELGYAPMNADSYREGYSLESLRELELVRLETEEAREGYYIDRSLDLLFNLIYEGWPRDNGQFELDGGPEHHTFQMAPLKSHLFDPQRTPILTRVRFRNKVLQRVIELMSLSDPSRRSGRSSKGRRGRISYAQLGINQLGAVYEALLSYRGFFADEDLYEVKKKGDTSHDELSQAYFVGEEDLPEYDEEERVYNEDGTLRKYEKGTFIYRLAGRDREKSASYYTPEVLTRSLVKYALKELIGDDETGMSADEILDLTVCEPAMGSAAFLNEAINQLSDAYLRRKQNELGDSLSPDQYAHEKQRVKMYIADNNVFGVDLNGVATELAEVSLWLNTIHEGGFVPWFGLQLKTGNSLIGARRQVFRSELLRKAKRRESTWLGEVPERIPLGKDRPEGTVYHFLLPDEGMAAYNDKVIKGLAGEEIKAIKKWKRDFTRGFSQEEIRTLERLSGAIDRLWDRHVKELERIRGRTTDTFAVYGMTARAVQPPTTTREKDRILQQELLSEEVRNSSPYRRLKLAMDYWCALWFWPIEQTAILPSRDEFLLELQLLLESEVFETGGDKQVHMFPDTMPKQLAMELKNELGFVDVDRLCKKRPRLELIRQIADHYRFHHWALEFADLFTRRGGFDLVLGNPPWIKVEWNESGLIGDIVPRYAIRKHRASELATLRKKVIDEHDLRNAYLSAFEEADATQHYLNARQNYPMLEGMKANLYKCFLPQGWMIGRSSGVSAFLHPEGAYDDPRGALLRKALYSRIECHFQFVNELQLFSDVDHHTRFSINIYRNNTSSIKFVHIANLYHPQTIDTCLESEGKGPVPGIKDEENNWNLNGHEDRIVFISNEVLDLFARIYDEEGTPAIEARLPAVHSRQIVDVLRKFAQYPTRLRDLEGFTTTQHWNETIAQEDGTIEFTNRFAESASDWIISGPHFFVGTPFYKTPQDPYTSNLSYDVVDLPSIPPDYLPRTLYTPACSSGEYLRRTPTVPWNDQKLVTKSYRQVNREMIGPSSERTFSTAIIPPGVAHIHTVLSTVFKNHVDLLDYAAMSSGVPVDFRVKTTGSTHANKSLVEQLPLLSRSFPLRSSCHLRILVLNCLTIHYSDLWSENWREVYRSDAWAKVDPRLPNSMFRTLGPDWSGDYALRTDVQRRQALIEIDVLTAMNLGLTLEELQTIYRVQFPVLRHYDKNTYYDQEGRIVYTNSRGLTGVGYTAKEWKKIKNKQEGCVEQVVDDKTLPGGPDERTITYIAPFTNMDREADYAEAWAHFQQRLEKSKEVGSV